MLAQVKVLSRLFYTDEKIKTEVSRWNGMVEAYQLAENFLIKYHLH